MTVIQIALILGCATAAIAGVIGHSPHGGFGYSTGPIGHYDGGHYDSGHYDHGHDGGDHGHDNDHHGDYYAHPKYGFDYGVKDPHTGDNKQQWETRDGDVVKGGYTVHEADGTTRVVEYTSDKHHGFNAVVKRVGHASHPQIYANEHGYGHDSHGHDDGHHYGHASSYASQVLH